MAATRIIEINLRIRKGIFIAIIRNMLQARCVPQIFRFLQLSLPSTLILFSLKRIENLANERKKGYII